jgi:hypothetical protein
MREYGTASGRSSLPRPFLTTDTDPDRLQGALLPSVRSVDTESAPAFS